MHDDARAKDDFSKQNASYIEDDIEAVDNDASSKNNFIQHTDFNSDQKRTTTTKEGVFVGQSVHNQNVYVGQSVDNHNVNVGQRVDVNDVCVAEDFDVHNSSGVRRFLLRSNQSRQDDDVTTGKSHQGQVKTSTRYLDDIRTFTNDFQKSTDYHNRDVRTSNQQTQSKNTTSSTKYLDRFQISNNEQRNSRTCKQQQPYELFTPTSNFDKNPDHDAINIESTSDSDESANYADKDDSADFEVEFVEKELPNNNTRRVKSYS